MAFGLAFTSRAQVRHSKTLLDPEIANIYIDGQQCFAIDLRTARTDYVTVEARMEGEYQGDVLVQVEKLGQTLRIGTGFSPAFSLPNDKLGAHKVLSVRLLVEVPEGEDVTVTGAQCQVATSGHYGNLVVQINNGGCQLEHLAEKTVVRTLDAPISAYVPAGVVRASSRHGKVLSDTIPAGVAVFELTSTHGDIHVWNKP